MTVRKTKPKSEAEQVMLLLKKYKIKVDELDAWLCIGESAIKQIEKDYIEDQYAYTNPNNTVFDDLPF